MSDYTWTSVYWMYSLMGLFVTGALFFLVKAIRSGAVANDEAPKYRMLEDDLPAPAAGSHGGSHE
ncbi:MAG: cbb3-type cytochrome oxidase assembly protein [Thermoanaerobaculia bacterium]